jgi:hypothetical protein
MGMWYSWRLSTWTIILIHCKSTFPGVGSGDMSDFCSHMHGHKFAIIGRSDDTHGESRSMERSKTPLRRDTIQVSGNSKATIRFVADNPGAWMFHCHLEVRRLSSSLTPTDLSLPVAPRIWPCTHLHRSSNRNANPHPPTDIRGRTVCDAWVPDVGQRGGTL